MKQNLQRSCEFMENAVTIETRVKWRLCDISEHLTINCTFYSLHSKD